MGKSMRIGPVTRLRKHLIECRTALMITQLFFGDRGQRPCGG